MVNQTTTFMLLTYLIVFPSSWAFASQEGKWTLDPEFSGYLTIMATNYMAITNRDIIDEVDAIRIYKTQDRDGRIYDLDALLTKELIFETREKALVIELIHAARVELMHVPKCYQSRLPDTFYVVAFDSKRRRAGYFLLNMCVLNGDTIGIVRPYQGGDSSTIYYNRSLVQAMQRNRIIGKQQTKADK